MIPRKRLLRLLWLAPMTLGVAYFALWACAPMFAAPSPVPVPDGRMHQLGIAGGSGFDFPGFNACDDGFFIAQCEGPQLQAYYRSHIKQIELSVVAHGGTMSLVGAGGLIRGYFVDGDARLGLSGGIGWLSAQVGVPMAVTIAPRVWLYTEPTVAASRIGAVRIPLGLEVHAGRVSIGLEGGVASGITGIPALGYGGISLGLGF